MLVCETSGLEQYLGFSSVIDGDHPAVAARHAELVAGIESVTDQARQIFIFVRDEIRHSADAGDHTVTLRASEVLAQGTGLCYTKSHLAAALLRRSGIPTGLCYQRLRDGQGVSLHGLIAVYLEGDWHRLDVRGEKPGVHAEFSLDAEVLPFIADAAQGESDLSDLLVDPAPSIIDCLTSGTDALTLHLPSSLADL